MTNEEALKKVCKDLNIEFDEGDMNDWGIVNSDPARVGEFMKYYKSAGFDEQVRSHVFELILSSYNDAILSRKLNQQLKADFSAIIIESRSMPALKVVREYWKEIYDRKDFPIGRLL